MLIYTLSGGVQLNTIDLGEVELKLALRLMMSEAGLNTFKELAANVGMKETTFRSALSNDSVRYRDLQKIAESMGYTLVLQKK